MKNLLPYLHAHVYFNLEQQDLASQLRQQLMKDLSPMVQVFPLVNRPIGPHPMPMFEIHFSNNDFDTVKDYLEKHRKHLSVLIHKISGDEIWDHTEGAIFLGEKLELNLDFLYQFMGLKNPNG